MEYTEEEKEAIEVAKEIVDKKYGSIMVFEIRDMEKILNLLDKQQKEIEKKNKIITEVERYARGIKDEELLLILKKDEIEK